MVNLILVLSTYFIVGVAVCLDRVLSRPSEVINE